MKARRAASPIIPGNTSDRTGTGGILRRAVADIRRRFDGLQREVLAIFARIPIVATNESAEFTRTLYSLTPDEMAATSTALQQALDRWIASGREAAHSFWWSPYDEEATQLGATQSLANLSRLSEAYAATRSLQEIVFSTPYRNRVAMAQIKSYDHWTGLSAGMRAELSQIIGRAVVDGKNPRAVRGEIAERLGVSKSRALGYAQTDVTDTLRQARMAEDAYAEEELGIATGELWTSALLPTTRQSHAIRSGKVYTRAQVQEFYGRDGNRYRCHCSITSCLLDTDGKPILTPTLKASMAKELATWKKTQK